MKRGDKFNSILAGATRVFAAKNLDAATTLEIANDSDVTEPLIFYHFKGKSDLFAQILRAAQSHYRDQLTLLPKSANPAENLSAIINLHFQYITGHPDEAVLLGRPIPKGLDVAYEELCKAADNNRTLLKTQLKTCIKDGIAGGSFFKNDPASTAPLLVLMLHQMMGSANDPNIGKIKHAFLSFCQRAMVRHE